MALPFLAIAAAGLNIGMGIWGASEAKKKEREAKEKERKARAEMNRLKNIYANLDTSNPFLNMENTS